MALTLEQIKAAFKKQDTTESRPSNYYRFWDMKIGEQAVVRFLPDTNTDNPFGFMVEKLMHTLEINGETKSIPCLKMYEDNCPICNVSSAYYKDEGKGSVNGKKYWRKKQHIVQALIVEDPLPANPETGETSEGKVKFLNLSYQIYSVIKEAFESGELDEVPYFFEGGCDFIIKKTEGGDYPKYDVGSKFARRSSDLTEDEIAVAEDIKSKTPCFPNFTNFLKSVGKSFIGFLSNLKSEVWTIFPTGVWIKRPRLSGML